MANFITGREKQEHLPTNEEVLVEGNRIAAEHFEEEKIFNQPSVVFEFGRLALQQPFPSEKYAPKVKQALKTGRLQLINFWGIENVSQAHSLMYANLGRANYNDIPGTLIRLPGVGQPMRFGEFSNCPLWVKKRIKDPKTGESFIHRGKGVSFFYPKDVREVLPEHEGEFIQQFIIPPDWYLRDIRTYVVGDRVIPGYVRKAKKPITEEQLRKGKPITEDQFVTAEHPGEVLPLEGELAEKAMAQAKLFRDAMVKGMKLNRDFLESQSVFGFGSVDFLQNEKGDLLVCDFDVGPAIRDEFGVMRKVAKALADYMIRLAHKEGLDRDMYVFADLEDNKFIQILESCLLQSEGPKRLIFKKSLEFEAYLSFLRKKKSEESK